MDDMVAKLWDLHDSYIRGTYKKAPVTWERVLLEHISASTQDGIRQEWHEFAVNKVYINTWTLKHIFDTRQAQEYDAVVQQLPAMVKQPDVVYKNLPEKRGELAFVKAINVTAFDETQWREYYFTSLELDNGELEVVTAYRFRSKRKMRNYLQKYNLMWSWEGGWPPS